MAAIDDAKRFLFLHPWSTTDVDNPVMYLEAVVKQFDDEVEAEVEALRDETEVETDVTKRLMAFIKGLRDDCKISESEYQFALEIGK